MKKMMTFGFSGVIAANVAVAEKIKKSTTRRIEPPSFFNNRTMWPACLFKKA
jgi:hypothetical protein